MYARRLPQASWRPASALLALALVSCSGSFASRMEEATGCSLDASRSVLGDCLSGRFAGADPADVDRLLADTGLVRTEPGTYVYSGGYSYGLTVFVHVQNGRVARVSAI